MTAPHNEYAQYSDATLREMRRESVRGAENAGRGTDVRQSENRRHAGQVADNHWRTVKEIDQELKHRQDAREAKQAESQGEEAARARQATAQHIEALGGQAVPVRVRSVETSWKGDDGHFYVGFYNPATDELKAWIQVGPGTPGARMIKGRPHLPADSHLEVRRAYGTEEDARK